MLPKILKVFLPLIGLFASASASFALPNCPSDQTKRYDNCFGTYAFPDGEKYVGEWKDNKKDGQGTYTFPDGENYVGEYKNGEKNGLGTNTFPDGDKFVGEYKNGEKNGLGTYTFGTDSEFSGDKFVGEYKDSKRNGKGFYVWKNGKADLCDYVNDKDSNCSGTDVYDVAPILTEKFRQLPEFQRRQIQSYLKSMDLYSSTIDGKWGLGTFSGIASYAAINLKTIYINNTSTMNTLFQKIVGPSSPSTGICPADRAKDWDNCVGEITFKDGAKYVGEWKNNKRNGQGTATFPDGENYVGEYKDDKKNGQGTNIWPDGQKYVGEWKNGKRDGQGTNIWAGGEKYVGEWKNNIRDGQGINIWPDGQKYVGGYKEDKRNGQGTYTFSDGEKYVGGYKDDKKEGQGIYIWPDGENYVGGYKDNKKDGQGTYTYADGEKYVGGYKEDKKDGQGTYTYPSGAVEEGIWKDNEFQYAQVSPEIVKPNDSNETREAASGTGFYVSHEGHIITNYHVIDGCMDMKVHTKGRVIPTLRISDDKQNDLALLKISETPSHVFALTNDSPFSLQEIVVAGFPFGESYSSSLKFTQGIVSSLTGIGNNYSEMQIDAALQPGNSGGPIIDEYGNIVGVAVAKLDAKYTFDNFGVIPENTNFGIKASAVRNFLEGNQVPLKAPNSDLISKRDLSRLATDGTVYLTCWMTTAQIETMRTKKVFFKDLN